MEPRCVVDLTCRECSEKGRFYFDVDKIKDCRMPTMTWNGWYLRNTELCPICFLERTHTITKIDSKGRITYTPKIKVGKNG